MITITNKILEVKMSEDIKLDFPLLDPVRVTLPIALATVEGYARNKADLDNILKIAKYVNEQFSS